MKTYFRSMLLGALALFSLAAVADSGGRATAAEGRTGVIDARGALAVKVVEMGGVRTAVAPSRSCGANPALNSKSGGDTRIARMDFEQDESADMESEDRDGIVPAIYTWKPETRFVFYRNMGKWM